MEVSCRKYPSSLTSILNVISLGTLNSYCGERVRRENLGEEEGEEILFRVCSKMRKEFTVEENAFRQREATMVVNIFWCKVCLAWQWWLTMEGDSGLNIVPFV